jgi:hypothetical protein
MQAAKAAAQKPGKVLTRATASTKAAAMVAERPHQNKRIIKTPAEAAKKQPTATPESLSDEDVPLAQRLQQLRQMSRTIPLKKQESDMWAGCASSMDGPRTLGLIPCYMFMPCTFHTND